ncbi:hypothetical protein Tco_0862108 [Tanacetum coccineum]
MRKFDEWWSTKKPDTDTEKGSSRGHKVPKVKKVESEKWRRLLLHQMWVVIVVSTDGREESSFSPAMESSDSVVTTQGRKEWRIDWKL